MRSFGTDEAVAWPRARGSDAELFTPGGGGGIKTAVDPAEVGLLALSLGATFAVFATFHAGRGEGDIDSAGDGHALVDNVGKGGGGGGSVLPLSFESAADLGSIAVPFATTLAVLPLIDFAGSVAAVVREEGAPVRVGTAPGEHEAPATVALVLFCCAWGDDAAPPPPSRRDFFL